MNSKRTLINNVNYHYRETLVADNFQEFLEKAETLIKNIADADNYKEPVFNFSHRKTLKAAQRRKRD